ncbi:MAG: hypothetical protein QOJ83_2554 [Frankiales bacterium]|nr:hypothetical protein [Frankiales bacterium]
MRRRVSASSAALTLIALVAALGGASLAGAQARADSPPVGRLFFSPPTGLDSYALTVVSTGTCTDPRGTNLQLRVSGAGFPDNTNVTPNLSASIYPTDPARHGYDVPLQDTLRDFAAQQHPAAALSGRYDFSLICKKPVGQGIFGTYTGSIWFTSGTHYHAAAVESSAVASQVARPPSPGVTGGANPATPTPTRASATKVSRTTSASAPPGAAGPASPTTTRAPQSATASRRPDPGPPSAQRSIRRTTAPRSTGVPAASPAAAPRAAAAATRPRQAVGAGWIAVLAAGSLAVVTGLGLLLRRRRHLLDQQGSP